MTIKFTLEFETDNAAYNGADLEMETAAILQAVANKISQGIESARIVDVNGNKVGQWEYEKDSIEYTNYYACTCGYDWQDTHDCACDDRCPSCNTSIQPYFSDTSDYPPDTDNERLERYNELEHRQ